MNDILPPKQKEPIIPPEDERQAEPVDPTPLEMEPSEPVVLEKSRSKKKLFTVLIGLVGAAVLLFLGLLLWYNQQLQPVEPGSNELVAITIPAGSTGGSLAETLKEKDVIRSASAFAWYVRLSGASGQLQAGPFKFSRGSSVPTIVETITSGKTETFSMTFYPGATLEDHRKVLLQAGFTEADIDQALAKDYDNPVFADKPASADLEGYIYGETYQFPTDVTVEQVLERTFSQLESVVNENNLVAAYKKQGLSLYEGITLASIIQREVSSAADSAQVAQVFLLRLKQGMQLGSDVTYQYIADKTGVARDPGLDSPYNTRRYNGLPPGPIASPGESALLAVANPAKGDYLYFLSGDDDKTYFARTNAEHEANIEKHCQKKCQIL